VQVIYGSCVQSQPATSPGKRGCAATTGARSRDNDKLVASKSDDNLGLHIAVFFSSDHVVCDRQQPHQPPGVPADGYILFTLKCLRFDFWAPVGRYSGAPDIVAVRIRQGAEHTSRRHHHRRPTVLIFPLYRRWEIFYTIMGFFLQSPGLRK
jgi:hypothetical protein